MVDKTQNIIGLVGGCYDCEVEFYSDKNGQALSAKHAKDFKHDTWVQITKYHRYNGREE